MGRLFDAVSSLLDLRHEVTYEAQAAMELEHLAGSHVDGAARLELPAAGAGDVLDPGPLLRAVVAGRRAGIERGELAAGFHVAVARAVGAVATRVRAATGLERVALSGGVFQNVLLLRLVRAELTAAGSTCSSTGSSRPTTAGWRWARSRSPRPAGAMAPVKAAP